MAWCISSLSWYILLLLLLCQAAAFSLWMAWISRWHLAHCVICLNSWHLLNVKALNRLQTASQISACMCCDHFFRHQCQDTVLEALDSIDDSGMLLVTCTHICEHNYIYWTRVTPTLWISKKPWTCNKCSFKSRLWGEATMPGWINNKKQKCQSDLTAPSY